MACDNTDILALLESMPYEKRKDPSTARKIAEMIAAKAAQKQIASTEFQEQSVELNEKMFKAQMDQSADPQQQAQQPQPLQPDAQDAAATPDIGALM